LVYYLLKKYILVSPFFSSLHAKDTGLWKTDHGLWVYISQAYLGEIWILYWLQRFILRCFPFNTQQIVLLHIVIFSLLLSLVAASLPSVFLIVGLIFRMGIPFSNPHGGMERQALGRMAGWSQGPLYF
jgi:hypothetical protein